MKPASCLEYSPNEILLSHAVNIYFEMVYLCIPLGCFYWFLDCIDQAFESFILKFFLFNIGIILIFYYNKGNIVLKRIIVNVSS